MVGGREGGVSETAGREVTEKPRDAIKNVSYFYKNLNKFAKQENIPLQLN